MTNDIFANYLKAAKRETLNEGASTVTYDFRAFIGPIRTYLEKYTKSRFGESDIVKWVREHVVNMLENEVRNNPVDTNYRIYQDSEMFNIKPFDDNKVLKLLDDAKSRQVVSDMVIDSGKNIGDVFNGGDFLVKTGHIAIEEIGAILLLDLEYFLVENGFEDDSTGLITLPTKS